MKINIDKILPNPDQPRKEFDPAELQGLADSIQEHGVIQPPPVEEAGDGYYILQDGERRWRAAKIAGLTEIPVVVAENADLSGGRLERALVANIQRSDLNPIEEARAFERLMAEKGLKRDALARHLGVSFVYVESRLALLELDQAIQAAVAARRLPSDRRVTRALLSIPDQKARVQLAAGLAERGATINTILVAAARLKGQLDHPQIAKEQSPALELAVQKAGPRDHKKWDALKQIGQTPPWGVVEASAIAVCKACALRDCAGAETCKDCPAVELLKGMLAAAQKETPLPLLKKARSYVPARP